MKEQDFLKSISNVIGNDYIGDDCAYLKDLGIVVTQDSLIEGIHFKREWYTPWQLGYKSIAVNISDILASGAKPSYVTVALSLPKNTTSKFIEEFYNGAQNALYGAKIVGGDVTGSANDIVISVMAIGVTNGRRISSRKDAKIGYAIVVKGNHGSSASGLNELINNGKNYELIKTHIMPELEQKFSEFISQNINDDYAMMDTSDGLADALYKIAEASNTTLDIDYAKIPHLDCVTKEQVLFGGEDYKLVAAIPYELAAKSNGTIIGSVKEFNGIRLKINNDEYKTYDELNLYNHFE